ncbi:phosphatidylinositol 4-phosphate 5-kinase 1 [Senna tora]|uniref:Phosphatidylinositol 4-phosphate 5-kinase 1 n=1 Tax=Senna tora TaxID=362788 RepID=A0A834T5Y1_9FABA|nr:phosphatidylinositol 4-phosphate 5-kinase 1 [Senna tora]
MEICVNRDEGEARVWELDYWVYSNGDVYEREFHKGKCFGSGVYYYNISGRYEGNWVDGKYDGIPQATANRRKQSSQAYVFRVASRDPTITSRARIFLSDMQKRFRTTDECVSAFRNTITTAPIPSATNTKNLGKKKRVIGKALMLDEIINYVQSLQHQVEFPVTFCEDDLYTIDQKGFGQTASGKLPSQSHNLNGSNQVSHSHMKVER